MLTVFIVVALLVGAVFAGELVRGQCARMLRRPHPSIVPAPVAAPVDSLATADSSVGV